MNIDIQRSQILRQQQATPKLHLMVQNFGHTTAQFGGKKMDRDMAREELNQMDVSQLADKTFNWDFNTADDATHGYDKYYGNRQEEEKHEMIEDVFGEPQVQMVNEQSRLISTTQGQDPNWIPDEQVLSCSNCNNDFTWLLSRHHCRICLRIYCKNCSKKAELKIEGQIKKVRACNNCIELNKNFNDTQEMQKTLLVDQMSQFERRAQSKYFNGIFNESSRMSKVDIQRIEEKEEYIIKAFNNSSNSNVNRIDRGKTNYFEKQFVASPRDDESAMFPPSQNRKQSVKQKRDFLTQRSTVNKIAMEQFLSSNHFNKEQSPGTADENNTVSVSEVAGAASQDDVRSHTSADLNTSSASILNSNDRTIYQWLDAKISDHLDSMIDKVITDYKVDPSRWRKILANCTKHAVITIKPSSRLRDDAIDFNNFIKIITVEHVNQEKCQYINGVVFKKDVANRRMNTKIENPKILLLSSSLGYVQEDEGFIDVNAEIQQQEAFIKIIQAKIQNVNPDLIFVQKDASRSTLEMLLKDGRTVVTNTPAKIMKMIAWATQTITCPSVNLLDKNFVVGYCLNFRVETIKPLQKAITSMNTSDFINAQNKSTLQENTSLMYLEGCQAKLGCSIVLSGPNMQELKNVRKALKQCLKVARIMALEREYLRFVSPDPDIFKKDTVNSFLHQMNQNVEDNSSNAFISEADGDKEPEMIIKNENNSEEQKLNRASTRSVRRDSHGNLKRDFAEYSSPYLFNKHMKRESLTFETFRLVTASKHDQMFAVSHDQTTAGGQADGHIERNAQSLPKGNLISGGSRDNVMESLDAFAPMSRAFNFDEEKSQNQTLLKDDKETNNENSLKRKLKNMCMRPKRQVVDFYNIESDKSLHSMIRQMAMDVWNPCPSEGCGKPMRYHKDYIYHANGCIEIQYQEDSVGKPENIRAQLQKYHPTFIHMFCHKCYSNVLTREVVPNEMLEMSFYKFIEQFFYNQRIAVSPQRQRAQDNQRKICNHTLHKDCSMVFRYGPIKIMMRYEPLDEYSLDMIHFGRAKGSLSDNDIRDRVTERADQLKVNCEEAFNLISLHAEKLQAFLEIAVDELPKYINQDLAKQALINIEEVVADLHMEFIIFEDKIMRQVFGDTSFTRRQHRSLQMRPEQNEAPLGRGKIYDLKTLMQVSRLHKYLSARICEYIFVLRKSNNLIKNSIIGKIFGKKNPFVVGGEQAPSGNIPSISQSQSFRPISESNSSAEKSQSNPDRNQPIQSSSPKIQEKKIIPDSYTHSIHHDSIIKQSVSNLPSQTQLQTLYQELISFDSELHRCKAISEIVEQNVFIPSGFNENQVELVKYEAENPGQPGNLDLASLVSMALSSNLYLSGMRHLEYLNLNTNLKVFSGEFQEQKRDSTQEQNENLLFANQQVESHRKVEIDHDVMNKQVSMEIVEQELLKNQANTFWFAFSTADHAMMEVLIDGKPVNSFRDKDENGYAFYANCEKVVDLSLVKQPLEQNIFDKLNQCHLLTKELKSEAKQRGTIMKKNPNARPGSNMDDIANSSTIIRNTRDPANDQTNMSILNQTQDMMGRKKDGAADPVKNYSHEEAYKEVYHMFHEKIEFSVKVFFPTHFEALRRTYCGSYYQFLQSFFRSDIWKDNSGGKTNSAFFKSFDNKYIIKGVESKEIRMFEEMSLSYFEYMSRSFNQQCPTAIAKTLGMFKIVIKRSNKTETYFMQLMENMFLNIDTQNCQIYDLKGSRRNRYIPAPKKGQTTLDNNFLFDRQSRPIPMQYMMKRLLKIAIANDSMYLTKHSIIDYSLLLIINTATKKVRVGIIDYIQTYTIDKVMESYVKQTLSKDEPTIIPPEQYKQRFRFAMEKYFIALLPDANQDINKHLQENFKSSQIQWFTKKPESQTSGAISSEPGITEEPDIQSFTLGNI